MKSRTASANQKLCLSCRACCKELRFYTHPGLYACSYDELVEFYKARGCTVTRSEGLLVLSLQNPCPYLADTGCTIYAKRPQVCRENTAKDELGKRCSRTALPEGRKKPGRKK